MAYVCELGAGQILHLDNVNGQTTIAIASTAPGQQQQAISRFHTGVWISTPEVYLTQDGAVIKLQAELGSHYIRVHGNTIGVSEAVSLEALEHLQMQRISGFTTPSTSSASVPTMDSIAPLPPMTMGNMSMSMNSMEMRMGDMELRMETPASSQRFCRRCGAAVKPDDRFCSKCGQQLAE